MEMMEDRLLRAGLQVFQDKGVRFTMDDLSREMGISKKTVYELIGSKEALIGKLINASHRSIRDQQVAILADGELCPAEKLERILTVLPVLGGFFEFGKLAELEERYPQQYAKMVRLLEDGWETTLEVYRTGVEAGELRVCHPDLFKMLYISSLTALFHDQFVLKHHMPYAETLKQVVSILMHGFAV